MVHDTRELNRTAVLTLLLQSRPASRKQLADASGISPATVSRTVEDLLAYGIVREVSELVTEQRGRRAMLLDVCADRTHVVGVDLGANRTRMIHADLLGAPLGQRTLPTPRALDGEQLARWTANAVRALAGPAWVRTDRVHVGLPGAVGVDGVTVSNVPNLPQVEGSRFLTRVAELLQRPVRGDNDANLALVGEQRFGAARGAPTAAMLMIGTGLGAGIAIDGRILRGAHGIVGEFGQLPVGPMGARLETMVTGPGILRAAADAGIGLASPAELFAADAAEPVRALRAQVEQALLIVLTATCVACEPEVIVLGGGVAASLTDDLACFEASLEQGLGVSPRLVGSVLGDFAGARGAVVVALHGVYLELGVDERALGRLPAG